MQLILQQLFYLVLIYSTAAVSASIYGFLDSYALNHSSGKLIVLKLWDFR